MPREEWWVGKDAVLQESETGMYWHVIERWLDVDTGRHRYRLADATHTRYRRLPEADVRADFVPAGLQVAVKPAAVFGRRVNGVLVGPNEPLPPCARDDDGWTFDCQNCSYSRSDLHESEALSEARSHSEHSRCSDWEIRNPDGEVAHP